MGLFDDTDEQDYLNQGAQAYQEAGVPTISSETVNNIPLQTVQGTVNPNTIQVAQQAPSAYNNISLDPATRAAQMQALTQYQQIANTPGLDPASKLAMQQIVDSANEQSQGAQGAIQQMAQAQGQGGGGFDLTQRAIAAQGASNNAAEQGMAAAAEAAQNRQTALTNMANIGAGVEGSDYAMAQNKAAAQNNINATNQAATNTANTGNVTNAINAGEFNTNTAQGVNAANATAGQNQAYYNAQLPQQQFNNQLAKAGGISGVSNNQANMALQNQQGQAAMIGAGIGAAGKMMAAAHGGVIEKPKEYTCYADGGMAHNHAVCMKLGGHVNGKAKVDGDSETNDTVPAMLSPGELVIPRSVPKDGEHMEKFAKNAPIPGTSKKIDLTGFTNGYKKRGTR